MHVIHPLSSSRAARLWLCTGLLLSGCSTAHVNIPTAASTMLPSLPPPSAAGFYHRVERKETLWSISRRYSVDLDTLVHANHLISSSAVNAGQALFIPTSHPSTTAAAVAPTTPAPLTSFQPDAQKFIWPVNGSLIASFGARHAGVTNQGIDVAAPAGTPVLAARGGRVAFVGNEVPGYGKTVIIDHGDGYNSVYAWNGEVLVAVGQVVPQRHPIAKVGATGRATAPSLHFEIRRGHRPQNPFYFLP